MVKAALAVVQVRAMVTSVVLVTLAIFLVISLVMVRVSNMLIQLHLLGAKIWIIL